MRRRQSLRGGGATATTVCNPRYGRERTRANSLRFVEEFVGTSLIGAIVCAEGGANIPLDLRTFLQWMSQ
jgi:hypothetical protein